jgi:diguanylate cyclase (GGDEF)-like protein
MKNSVKVNFFRSIRFRFTVWFFLVLFIPFAIAGAALYLYARSTIYKNTFNYINSMVDAKVDAAAIFINAKIGRTIDFASDGFIRDMTELIGRMSYDGEVSESMINLNNHLAHNKAPLDPDILETFVIDLEGEIIASSNPEHLRLKVADADYFTKAKRYGGYITNIHRGMDADETVIEVSRLLNSSRPKKVKTIGVLVNRIKGSVITSMLLSQQPAWQRAGMTDGLDGNTRLKIRTCLIDCNNILIGCSGMNKEDVFKKTINSELVMRFNESGELTSGEYQDRQGNDVIGALGYVDDLDLLILMEMEASDAFAALTGVKRLTIIIAPIIFLVIAGVAYLLSSRMLLPIIRITDFAGMIAEGKLNDRIVVNSRDEIGVLGHTINYMIGRLDKSIQEIKRAKEDWESTFDSVTDLIALYDSDCRLTNCNKWLLDKLNVRIEDIAGKSCYEVSRLGKAESMLECAVLQAVTVRKTKIQEKEISCLDGIYSISCYPHLDKDGKFIGAIQIMTDVTERMRVETELKVSEARLHNVVDRNVDSIVIVDKMGIISFVNPAAETLFGRKADELIGESFGFPTVVGETTELDILHKGGESVVAEMRLTEIDWAGENVRLAMLRDITEHKKFLEHQDHVARYDILTDLPNRILFIDRVNHEKLRAKREKEQIAVLYLNLDRFKVINDSMGNETGDRLLKSVAERMVNCVREGDTVSRMGADEFAIMLGGIISTPDITKVSQKIIEAVSKPIVLDDQEIIVTVSIGIGIYPQDEDEDEEWLIKKASTAMQQAKECGRNNYRFYNQKMETISYEMLMLENDLRKVLDRKELLLYYQPQVDINTGRIIGVEALVRWMHPDRGMVSPAEFIPLAEETGLIVPIGEWVLHTALAQNKAWQEEGLAPVKISVNFSSVQFRQKDPVELVANALRETGLDPGYMGLEITENVIMKGADAVIKKFHELKGLGIHICMDDFGTGYSSLSYLKRFPIDILKIDQSFARNVTTDTNDASIVTATIAMAHGLGITTIAEGVETKEQLQFFRSHKCEIVQGYLFSKPLPAEDITKLLREGGCFEI